MLQKTLLKENVLLAFAVSPPPEMLLERAPTFNNNERSVVLKCDHLWC